MSPGQIQFDWTERFPRLARAPIVEAVIHWRARPQNAFDPATLGGALAERLPHYPVREPIHEMELLAMVSDKEDASVVRQKRGWQGIRLKSEDGRYVVQFKKDGLIFSRTGGYDHWEPFRAAAWRGFAAPRCTGEPTSLNVRSRPKD